MNNILLTRIHPNMKSKSKETRKIDQSGQTEPDLSSLCAGPRLISSGIVTEENNSLKKACSKSAVLAKSIGHV